MKVFLTFVLSHVMSIPLIFASTARSDRLQNYFFVRNQDQLIGMTAHERAEYILLVVRTYQIIEASLMRDHLYIDTPGKFSSFFWIHLMMNPELNAALPLAPIAGGMLVHAAKMTAPSVLPFLRAKTYPVSSGATHFFRNNRWANFNKNSPEIVDAVTMRGGGAIRPAATASLAIVGGALVTQSSRNSEIKRTHSSPDAALSPIPDSERRGLFCIFGGFPRRYEQVGDVLFCPSPREQINHLTCRSLGYRPSFKCQSFGLSEKLGPSVSSSLCVPFRNTAGNLDDLTVRCAQKFEQDFLPKIQSINMSEFENIQSQLLLGLEALEAERGIQDIGLLGYCQGQNAVNLGRQVSECTALLGLISKLKGLSSVINRAGNRTRLGVTTTRQEGFRPGIDQRDDPARSSNSPPVIVPIFPSRRGDGAAQ